MIWLSAKSGNSRKLWKQTKNKNSWKDESEERQVKGCEPCLFFLDLPSDNSIKIMRLHDGDYHTIMNMDLSINNAWRCHFDNL